MSAVARRRGGDDGREAGQAQIELIAAMPFVVLAAALVLQLFAVGYAQSLADGSAEAGAIALANGRPAGPAARTALPGWARSRVGTDVDGGRVAVRLDPPSLLPGVGRHLEVTSSAWARPSPGAGAG